MKHNYLGHCGLDNMGNTCFLNSILQLIIHCRPIITFLIKKQKDRNGRTENGDYVECLERNIIQKNPNITTAELEIQRKRTLTDAVANLINKIYINGSGTAEPKEIKYILGEKIPRFSRLSQEDSQEALLMILDIMFEETGVNATHDFIELSPVVAEYIAKQEKKEKVVKEIKEASALCKTDDARIEELRQTLKSYITRYREYKNKFYSNPENVTLLKQYNGQTFIRNTLNKQYNMMILELSIFTISCVKCNTCGTENCTFEVAKMLDVHVKPTLEEALLDYAKNESITDYMCDTCGCSRTVTKTMKIWQNPNVLFIHIKKYHQKIIGNQVHLMKDETKMDLPDEIDICRCCEDRPHVEKLSTKYKLFGISNHSGNLGGGHYTADCRSVITGENFRWYNYNDSFIGQLDGDDINKSKAYIAMYELMNV